MWQWLNGIDESVWVVLGIVVLVLGVIARVRWIMKPTSPVNRALIHMAIGQRIEEILKQKGVKKITLKRRSK